jgi:hypothetical protein
MSADFIRDMFDVDIPKGCEKIYEEAYRDARKASPMTVNYQFNELMNNPAAREIREEKKATREENKT